MLTIGQLKELIKDMDNDDIVLINNMDTGLYDEVSCTTKSRCLRLKKYLSDEYSNSYDISTNHQEDKLSINALLLTTYEYVVGKK
jgi:hypothetical protein